MEEKNARPDFIVKDLYQAVKFIEKLKGEKDGTLHRHC
jgi:hypothetical protein